MLVLCRYKHKNGGEKTRLVNLQGEGKLLFACFFLGGTLISCWWGSVSGFHDSDGLSADRRVA